MLVKAPEEPEYLQWLATLKLVRCIEPAAPLHGVRYEVNGAQRDLAPAQCLKIILPVPPGWRPIG